MKEKVIKYLQDNWDKLLVDWDEEKKIITFELDLNEVYEGDLKWKH